MLESECDILVDKNNQNGSQLKRIGFSIKDTINKQIYLNRNLIYFSSFIFTFDFSFMGKINMQG
jgi:hypothetical protein